MAMERIQRPKTGKDPMGLHQNSLRVSAVGYPPKVNYEQAIECMPVEPSLTRWFQLWFLWGKTGSNLSSDKAKIAN